jgi:hypothetical protein
MEHFLKICCCVYLNVDDDTIVKTKRDDNVKCKNGGEKPYRKIQKSLIFT